MRNDPNVFVIGRGRRRLRWDLRIDHRALRRFGSERVIDTPISETGFIGAGIGAAVEGMRPIVELMFIDFFGVCMDQITNHMAKIHYESGGNVKVPMVLMSAVGGGYSDAAQHCQCLWGTFAHLPGIKVVVPSNPYDAKGLMISAIRDDNPVLYHVPQGRARASAWMRRTLAPSPTCPKRRSRFPSAKAASPGRGLTSRSSRCRLSVQHGLDAGASSWQTDGISVEVVDLRSPRSARPRDRSSRRFAKTGRLLVVDEDYRSFGLTGEIAAVISEHDPGMLTQPFRRLAVPDVPIPYARPLEQGILPTRDKIAAAVRELMA